MLASPNESNESNVELKLAQRLIKVGIALSAERNFDRLFNMIVSEVRSLTRAEGASLYLRQGDQLCFKVSQNEVLQRKAKFAGKENILESFCLPLNDSSQDSIAGYVVKTGQILNLPDVHHLGDGLPYRFNPGLDKATGYRTKSMLTVPMRNVTGEVLGALQLINYQSKAAFAGDFSPFPEIAMHVAESLASQAAVSYANILLEERLRVAYRDTIQRLAAAAEYRDPETANHLIRMSHYCRIIAQQLGLSPEQQQLIFDASPMHDVGKLGIPDAILLKPGAFTPEERMVMQQHAEIGAEILDGSDSELLQMSARIALAHHEKFDGTGYPQGLKGEDIPIEARIVALADVFDALSSKRVYKRAWQIGEVLTYIQENSGSHFDPVIVAAFFSGFEEVMAIYDRYHDWPDVNPKTATLVSPTFA